MNDRPENPYAAPAAAIDPDDPGLPSRWLLGWVGVYVVNLIGPLLLGRGQTRGAGWFGVLAGVAFMFLLSLRWLVRNEKLRSPLMIGGIVVAISQVVPVLQFIAGGLAMVAREVLLEGRPGPPGDGSPIVATFAAGLIVTVLTGGMLMLAAVAAGAVLMFLGGAWKDRKRGIEP